VHLPLSAIVLAGCGLNNVLPGPPVVTGSARADFEVARPAQLSGGAPLTYTSAPRVDYPVPPLQVFALKYAIDVVLVSDHPDWVMHEYARVDLPVGPLWLAKDAGVDREQTITADIDHIERWAPEVPVQRREGSLRVDDRSGPGRLDASFDYTNPKGQSVHVEYDGRLPTQPSKPRNGNTMGHSRKAVAALLDLYLFRTGGKASITIDGTKRRFHRLLGLLPEVYLLAQTQGGFAATDFRISKGDSKGFVVNRPGSSADWPTRAEQAWETTADGWTSQLDWNVVGARYHFVEGELDRAQVFQAGEAAPILDVAFSPRLPDVRRTFSGTAVSRFVVDINGQAGHGVGTVACTSMEAGATVALTPTAPRWFADRSMVGGVTFVGEEAEVWQSHVPDPAD
jgi:hypothetical protein